MYAIYADGEILYAPNLSAEGYAVINPQLTLEVNKAGSLTFTLPPTNPLYNNLKKLKTIITVYDDTEQVFRGRILHDDRDYMNRKSVYCEGEQAFLLDSAIRPYEFAGTMPQLLSKLIDEHNSQVEDKKRFIIGSSQVGDGTMVTRTSSVYPTTWEELNTKFISMYGGRFEFHNQVIDYVSDDDSISDQVIEFGHNLLDLTEHISADSVCTVLIPLGKGAEEGESSWGKRTTIAEVNGGKDYIENAEAIALFGRITKIKTWDNLTSPSKLLAEGRKYLAENIEMATTLTVKAVDLHLLDVNTDRIRVGQKIRVLSLPHGIDTYFLCSKIVVNMTSPDKTSYTLGTTLKGVTEHQIQTEQLANSVVMSAENANKAADEAKAIVGKVDADTTKALDITLRIKGVVDTTLPTSGMQAGDVWIVRDTGQTYMYTGNDWEEITETLSQYSTYTTAIALSELDARVSALEGN